MIWRGTMCGGTTCQVLGGTAQRGDTDIAPRQEDRDHIWRGCLGLMPSLAQAKVSAPWTCMPPFKVANIVCYLSIYPMGFIPDAHHKCAGDLP